MEDNKITIDRSTLDYLITTEILYNNLLTKINNNNMNNFNMHNNQDIDEYLMGNYRGCYNNPNTNNTNNSSKYLVEIDKIQELYNNITTSFDNITKCLTDNNCTGVATLINNINKNFKQELISIRNNIEEKIALSTTSQELHKITLKNIISDIKKIIKNSAEEGDSCISWSIGDANSFVEEIKGYLVSQGFIVKNNNNSFNPKLEIYW